MKERDHVLISLEERHAINILAGAKRVELRRRIMHVKDETFVWLYVKKPVGAVVGYAVVDKSIVSTPTSIWRKFGEVSGLLKSEYVNYFDGATCAFALLLVAPQALKRPVALDELRSVSPGFQPPQFYCRLAVGSALCKILTRRTR
jgi:predicted transcriptional regulator